MARPQKEGLEYFPLDVDMDQDDKLFFIEAKHGLIGFAVVVRLLMLIYKDGYYKTYTEDKEAFMLAKRLSVEVNVLNNIISDCINEDIFDKQLFKQYGILTSRGIQKRYLEACARRKEVNMIMEYCLINPKNYKNLVIEHINLVNVDINHDKCNSMPTKSTQSKVKESKGKESKNHKSDSENPTEPEKPKEPSPQQVIFKHWNSKRIIQHRSLTDKLKRSINGALNDYTQDEICIAIDNYAVILTDEKYYWSYKWALKEFIARGLDKFIDFETAAKNYLTNKNPRGDPKKHKHQDFNQREYTDTGDFFNNLEPGDSI